MIRTTISALVVGALLVGTSARTTAQQRDAGRVRVDTLEGGRIVVSNPDSPEAGPEGVPTLVEVLRIGSLDDTCDAFGNVMSLAVDGDGRIYVADSQASEIRVFSPEGECVGTFGRSGEGPGEFSLLAGIAWQPPGFLWTIDSVAERLTVFDSLGTVLATHPMRLGPAAAHPWPMWVDGGGSLHFWVLGFDRIVKYGTGPGLDVLESSPEPEEIPTREAYTEQMAAGGSRISVQRGIPYLPHILWTMNPSGNVWQANSSVFAIHETTYGGDTLRTVRLDREAPRLEGRERDSIADAVGIAASSTCPTWFSCGSCAGGDRGGQQDCSRRCRAACQLRLTLCKAEMSFSDQENKSLHFNDLRDSRAIRRVSSQINLR
ncbi:MAG: 6-bladed beta-propeller [Gemmatimonadota bacterium]|nr:6-bladed beta-propeller [Gemmatimonadota bacterium]